MLSHLSHGDNKSEKSCSSQQSSTLKWINQRQSQESQPEFVSQEKTESEKYSISSRYLFWESEKNNKKKEKGRFNPIPVFEKKLKFFIIETNLQSAKVLLHYGFYKLTVTVIFTRLKPQTLFEVGKIANGGFGTVRSVQFEGENIVVKNIQLKKRDAFALSCVYKEYFIACLASTLQFGPKINNIFGFDIVITEKSAFFAMQQCRTNFTHSNEIIEECLKANLQEMHSLKLIHIDIKPQNIAFSRTYQKYVFLDFGLSSFITQNQGQKVRTKFFGTLSFCSEQMKKSYFLQKQMEVDLYKNDRQSLHKSLKFIQNQLKVKEKNPFIQYQSTIEYGNFHINENLFEKVIRILQLKYFLYIEDFQKVIQTLFSSRQLPRTCHVILNSNRINPKFCKNQNICKLILENREMISKQMQKHSENTDQFLSTFFSTLQMSYLHHQVTSVEHILSLEERQFMKVMEEQELVYRLYVLFDPFEIKNNSEFKDVHKLRQIIADKIYKISAKTNKKDIHLLGEKMFFVLTFFYERLKKINNRKILQSLRMLFISLRFHPFVVFVTDLQKCIYNLIEDPKQKMIKLIQYRLFWDIYTKGYPNGLGIDLKNVQEPKADSNPFQSHAYSLAKFFYQNSFYDTLDNTIQGHMMKNFGLLFNFEEAKQYLHQILIIKGLIQISIRKSIFLKFRPDTFILDIYDACLTNKQFSSNKKQIKNLLRLIHQSPNDFVNQEESCFSEDNLREIFKIDNIQEKVNNSIHLPGCKWTFIISNQFSTSRQYLLYVADNFFNEDNQFIQKNEFKVYLLLKYLFAYTTDIRKNQQFPYEYERLTKSQLNYIRIKVNQWIDYLDQVEAVEFRNNHRYQLMVSLLRIQMLDNLKQQQAMLYDILLNRRFDFFYNKTIAIKILKLYERNQERFFKKQLFQVEFQKLCDEFLAKKIYFPFQNYSFVLKLLIQTKVALKKFQECFWFIIQIIDNFSEGWAFVKSHCLVMLMQGCNYFCCKLDRQSIFHYHKIMKNQYKQFYSMGMQLFKMLIFMKIFNELGLKDKVHYFDQLATNARDEDSHYFYTEVRSCLFSLVKFIRIPRSKRLARMWRKRCLPGSVLSYENKIFEYTSYMRKLVEEDIHNQKVFSLLNQCIDRIN